MAVRSVNFELAAKESEEKDEEELLDVVLKDANGELLDASMMVRRPSAGEFTRLTISFNRSPRISDLTPAVDHFLEKIIVPPNDVAKMEGFGERDDFVDVDWIWDLVEDRDVDFDISDVMDLIAGIMKEFEGFPTKSSSGSSGGRKSSGRSSTGASRRAGSTRSRSASVVSET